MIVLDVLGVIGTIAFALAGALTGIQKKLDVFGILMLSITTAVGGGILRDMLIGNTPPMAFRDPTFVVISIISAICACLVYQHINRFNNLIQFCDAVGLGAFTAAGANMAILYDINTPFIMIVLGVTTGVGGGIIRDLFVQEIPFVFRKEIYAVAAIVGAASFYYTQAILPDAVPMYLCFVVTSVIRILSIIYDLHLPII
ncbi:trimeric intracellular cation channel family protein [Dendrosporobacter sp. 1207_IL3150]|uniref:trimeric intracellular cation channel family protein n=1 Tax=Dendrosporobacter sp. 1207_IL3150 TaxID=3084054 RepID=UPI002FDB3168